MKNKLTLLSSSLLLCFTSLIGCHGDKKQDREHSDIIRLINTANEEGNFTIDVKVLDTNQESINMTTFFEKEDNLYHFISPVWNTDDPKHPYSSTESYFDIHEDGSMTQYVKLNDNPWQSSEISAGGWVELLINNPVYYCLPGSDTIVSEYDNASYSNGVYSYGDITYQMFPDMICKDVKIKASKTEVVVTMKMTSTTVADYYIDEQYTLSKVGSTSVSLPDFD